MHIGQRNSCVDYKLKNIHPKETKIEDLGIYVLADLNSLHHVNVVAGKKNLIEGIIQRNFTDIDLGTYHTLYL